MNASHPNRAMRAVLAIGFACVSSVVTAATAPDRAAITEARAHLRTTSVLAEAPDVGKACRAVTVPDCKECRDLPLLIIDASEYRKIAALRTGGVPEGNVAMFVPAQSSSSLPAPWRAYLDAAGVKPPVVFVSADVRGAVRRRLVIAHEFGHYLYRRHFELKSPVIQTVYRPRTPAFNDAFARHALDDERATHSVVWEGCGEANLRESIDRWQAVYGNVEEEFAITMEARAYRILKPAADFDGFFCTRFDGIGSRVTLEKAGYRPGPCPDGYALALQRFFLKIWERAGQEPVAGDEHH